ncbi:MAG: hypothetical protein J6M60_03655 [Clostridia bacterium]|nr:hypothetical protein [Clostridia bacterium]
MKSIEINKEFEDKDSKLDLPTNMTIGMEIESEGDNSNLILNCKDKFAPGWKCKKDGSLNRGVEIVSPILTGDNNETAAKIKYVCRRLGRLRTGSFKKLWRTYTYRS